MIRNSDGIIKFELIFTPSNNILINQIDSLNAWRNILFREKLVGCEPERYNGAGYGNLSMRDQNGFIITGSQTGKIAKFTEKHYCLVTDCDILKNKITARGDIKPSSESLTHAALYQADYKIKFVFHAHSPEIWKNANILNIPMVEKDAEYGTQEIAYAIQQAYLANKNNKINLFAMAGHKDGIISFGKNIDQAGSVILETLKKIRSINENK